MRASLHGFAVASIVLVLAGSAEAQSVPCVAGLAMGGVIYGVSISTKNAPFSGTVKTSFEQKLADGNVIHGARLTHQARDSAGRAVVETGQGCVLGADGQMHEWVSVNVNDPVARTSMSWEVGDDSQSRVVRVTRQPDPVSRPKPDPAIPPGEEGNDQPLVVVNETWRSQAMGLTMMAISDDPRRGRTVTEYEELNLGEPDPGLFTPPADYKVQEQPVVGIMQ